MDYPMMLSSTVTSIFIPSLKSKCTIQKGSYFFWPSLQIAIVGAKPGSKDGHSIDCLVPSKVQLGKNGLDTTIGKRFSKYYAEFFIRRHRFGG